MANRKERKKLQKPYSWENPPIGNSEPKSGPSKVVQDEVLSTSQIVRKILKGDITIKHQGYYDSPDVKDVPMARRKNASLINVVDDIRERKIATAINQDIQEKLAKKATSEAGAKTSSPAPKNRAEAANVQAEAAEH